MLEISESCTNSNVEGYHLEAHETEGAENCISLWSIDDDTMFYAQGLKHHSAGIRKSVYVTWNENYLLNFVFKTSSNTGATTLTKVRIAVPLYNQQQESISNTLILEMNTLLYMKSGNVYYFSSVKSMHRVEWLSGVRCMTSCPPTQFSVIRLLSPLGRGVQDQNKTLSLEVYKDVPQLGKRIENDVLRHSYDITFDLDNLFGCDWLDEIFTLTSLITDQNNITFLQQLVSIGDLFRGKQDIAKLDINQEVHIYTISGNVFILVGGMVSDEELIASPQVENFSIHLLNIYTCPIERIFIDCTHNLLIVLLQTGHMDIWYKSNRMFDTLLHCQHEIPKFLCYDFSPSNNFLFFTTPEEVLQLKIITKNSHDIEKECIVKETRKCLSGMVACTFVESLQHLICLSINNIFYKIHFATTDETTEKVGLQQSETNVENLNYLHALNSKRLTDLRAKAHIVEQLVKQPKYLYNTIEREFRKQKILGLESKSELLKKLFLCRLEYHVHLPGADYFDDSVYIKTKFRAEGVDAQSIFCLIFMSPKNNNANFLSSIFTSAMWYLHISYFEQYFQLHIPYEILNKKLCIIVDIQLKDVEKQILPKLSLDLLTFLNHNNHSLCLRCNLNTLINERTYINLFSVNIQNLQIFRNSFDNIKVLLKSNSKSVIELDNKVALMLKQCHKIPKNILYNAMEKLNTKMSSSSNGNIKIYYLYKYLIELNYDEFKQILTIRSIHSPAMLYLKLFLMHAMQSLNDESIDRAVDHTMQQMLINCGSVISSDPDSNVFSMHLENLRNVYLKLRLEFFDTLR